MALIPLVRGCHFKEFSCVGWGTEPTSPVETLLQLATVMTSRIICLALLGTTEIGLGGSVDQLHVDVEICQT